MSEAGGFGWHRVHRAWWRVLLVLIGVMVLLWGTNALVITSNDTRPSKGMGEAIQDQLKKRCGDECKATLTNVPVADWAAKVQGEVQSALNRDGEINTVLPIFDSMIQYVDPGVRQAGADRDIKSYSFNGTPSLNSFLTNDRSTFQANVGEDPLWIAYLTMDQAFRVMLDKKPVDRPRRCASSTRTTPATRATRRRSARATATSTSPATRSSGACSEHP